MATFFSPLCILDHLMTYLPRLTDRFSDNAIVSAEIIAGTPQTLRVTDTAHGLSAGSKVVLIDGKIDNSITGVVDNLDGTLRFTTAKEHDLTLDFIPEIELAGFTNPAFNGVFPLDSVPSRTLFEIEAGSLPVLNGNEVLRENWQLGINGTFTIDTIVDANTYDILLTDKPEFTPQTVPSLRRASDFRIYISVDLDRAESHYTKKTDLNDLVLYIAMGDSNISKDRNLKNDATIQNTAGQQKRPLNINTFSLIIFMPTKNETAAARAVQIAWDTLYKLFLAVASGIQFDDFGNSAYQTAEIGHGAGVYTNAYYSHVYDFEYSFEVTQEEEFLTQFIESRAFRDDAISFNELQEGSELDLDGDAP